MKKIKSVQTGKKFQVLTTKEQKKVLGGCFTCQWLFDVRGASKNTKTDGKNGRCIG